MESLISHVLSFFPGNNFEIRLPSNSLSLSLSSSKLWYFSVFFFLNHRINCGPILQTGAGQITIQVFPKAHNTFRARNVGRESELLLPVKDTGDL